MSPDRSSAVLWSLESGHNAGNMCSCQNDSLDGMLLGVCPKGEEVLH